MPTNDAITGQKHAIAEGDPWRRGGRGPPKRSSLKACWGHGLSAGGGQAAVSAKIEWAAVEPRGRIHSSITEDGKSGGFLFEGSDP